MKIAILGTDGYIGTALNQYLTEQGHEVFGCDNALRKRNVAFIGSQSIVEKVEVNHLDLDITEYEKLKSWLKAIQPDTIVHLAEQPSAPFSMLNAKEAAATQQNNIIGTLNVLWAMKEVCPEAHLVKLGTEGEYPDWIWDGKHIPEGSRMKVMYSDDFDENGVPNSFEPWTIPTPRYFGSWYHATKMFDSYNIDYACRVWGLTATDVNQGVVYGHEYNTRLDIDEHFGTVVNRFCAQAVSGMPLTVYGTGGQTRGFIALKNSLEAIKLLSENPPEQGEFRVIHQTTKEYSVRDIAHKVQQLTGCKIDYIDNPRAEQDSNKFTFENKTLMDLGLMPIGMDDVLPGLIKTIEANKDRIIKDVIYPKTKWK